jgi:two-component system CheB/CheR fusion protein
LNESDPATSSPFDGMIVALGASAGGLDALDRFFAALQPRDDTAFVVIQHLAPEHTTMMDTLLARHTDMQVAVASPDIALQGRHVYVIPPGTTMTVRHGRLRLAPRPATGVTLPIDAFFESLAAEAPQRAVGIVLSGTGSDGSRGIVALDDAGAWVLAQNPETARFDGMPRAAIATGAVDQVLSPEELAAEIGRLVDLDEPTPSGVTRVRFDGESAEALLRAIGAAVRIDVAHYKPNTVRRRVERRMHALGIESLEEYAGRVRADSAEADELRGDLLIPVTRFFRDPDAFAGLRTTLETSITDRPDDATAEEPFRAWIAATATGQEAYSIAIVLLELLAERAPGRTLTLFATDTEARYLERASAGVYTELEMADVSAERRQRWFEPVEGGRWRVSPTLREQIVFSRHDLLTDAPFTQLDLVSCRNVLIYLRPAAQDRVVRRLTHALRTGGVLFLGTSETPAATAESFEVVDPRQKLYRLRRRPPALPPEDLISSLGGSRRSTPRRPDALGRATTRPPIQAALDLVAREYAPPSLLVSADRHLVHVFGDAGDLLRMRTGETSLDVLQLLPPPLVPVVASLLHGAIRDHRPQRSHAWPLTVHGDDRHDDDPRDGGEAGPVTARRISVWPLVQAGVVDHLLIAFETPGAGLTDLPLTLGDTELEALRTQHVTDLERELALTRSNLQETIQELGTANEELQAYNEELMAANEELQSTNEELQSVNEELHTVNAEYQARITELRELNADMETLSQAIQIPLVFVDADLRLSRFSPAAMALFPFRPGDLGRPITDVRHRLDFPDLEDVLRSTLATEQPHEREVVDETGHAWLVTVLPYTLGTGNGRAVITCVDVSSMRLVKEPDA